MASGNKNRSPGGHPSGVLPTARPRRAAALAAAAAVTATFRRRPHRAAAAPAAAAPVGHAPEGRDQGDAPNIQTIVSQWASTGAAIGSAGAAITGGVYAGLTYVHLRGRGQPEAGSSPSYLVLAGQYLKDVAVMAESFVVAMEFVAQSGPVPVTLREQVVSSINVLNSACVTMQPVVDRAQTEGNMPVECRSASEGLAAARQALVRLRAVRASLPVEPPIVE